MSIVNAIVQCDVPDSFRVQQVAGMFDLSVSEKSRREFTVEVPGLDDDWQIGAIVGPSGSGKTTIARSVYGDSLYTAKKWARDRAVIDCFGDFPIKEITQMLTSVGLSSPPAWVRPYRTLSNGEQFRCDLARSLLSNNDIIAFDEFTSVVDRTVAKIGSAAVAKSIHKARIKKRFVAVSCHYDILEWLQPDWVVDMAICQLARGRLQRPDITIEIIPCKCSAWRLFAPHHYLSATIHKSSQCFLAVYEGRAVAFAGVLPVIGKVGQSRITRLVTLPDFQGVGIGRALLNAVAEIYKSKGRSMSIRTSHPAMIRSLPNSAKWRTASVYKHGGSKHAGHCDDKASFGRAVASFRYCG